jgi:dienelactone hydrolase
VKVWSQAIKTEEVVVDQGQLEGLLGVPPAASVRPQTFIVGPVSPWRGVFSRRVLLVTDDAEAVPCLYLTPTEEGPWSAGAVAVHQHNHDFPIGKSEPAGRAGNPGLAYGLALARLGVATIIPDLLGFEERRGPYASDAEFEQQTAWSLVADGKSLQGRHAQDAALATSWLSGGGKVDGPIGIVGHSLGGQVALFSLAYDRRLSAGVISCGLGTLASFRAMHVLHNPAWHVPGLAAAGDVPGVASLIRSRPVFAVAGTSDPLFPSWGVREVAGALGKAPVDLRFFDGGHGFPAELQNESLRWLAHVLGASQR